MLKFLRSGGSGGTVGGSQKADSPDNPHVHPHPTHLLELMRKPPAVGYPRKPTCLHLLSPNPQDYILLIGTAAGTIKIVPYTVEKEPEEQENLVTVSVGTSAPVIKILSLPNSSDFHVLSTANTLHHFQATTGKLLREANLAHKLSSISTFALTPKPHELIFLGTEVGNLYKLVKYGAEEIATASEINSNNTQNIIYSEILTQNSPLSSKKPGPVEGLEYFLFQETAFLLIAFQRGLIVQWNVEAATVIKHFYPTSSGAADLEYLHLNSSHFYTSYSDGSYLSWELCPASTTQVSTPASSATPYGPYPTLRIPKISTISDQTLIAFSGGLPKSEYGDRFSVSLLRTGEEETHVTFDLPSKVVDFFLCPQHLFIATEEELIITDTSSCPTAARIPAALDCFHPSAVTCLFVSRQTLFTGHEDGSVRMWDSTNFSQINDPIHTRDYFEETRSLVEPDDEKNEEADDEDEWPPFKKVGAFDPYSDDVRLSIKKLGVIGDNLLLVGGTAGQVLVLDLGHNETTTKPGTAHTIHLSPKEFVWKGHEALTPVKGKVCMAQLSPPGGVTVLCGVKAGDHVLISIGSSHGYGVWNLTANEIMFSKSTLILELSDSGNEFSRRKSLKKSLRESFRRLRKSRGGGGAGQSPSTLVSAIPKERAIDDAIQGIKTELSGLVRLMEWTKGAILTVTTPTPMLIVGLHSGLVQILTLHILGTSPSLKLSKEIQLKHGAPVVSTYIIDGTGRPVEWNGTLEPSGSPIPLPHRLLLLSEEQIKLFTLPTLRPWGSKLKITAHEGIRMKKSIVSSHGLRILLNNGSVRAVRGGLNLDLKRGAIGDFKGVVPEGDLSALTSFVFAGNESYYMSSSSEIQRVEWVWDDSSQPELKVPSPQKVKSHKRTSSDGHHHNPSVLSTVIEENSQPGPGQGSPDTTIDEVRDHTIMSTSTLNGVTTTQAAEETSAVVTVTTTAVAATVIETLIN